MFLWEVPKVDSHADWPGWTTEHFKLFEVVVPRPGPLFLAALSNTTTIGTRLMPLGDIIEILFLGTGDAAMLPPPHIKKYLNDLGIQLDVMNTVRVRQPSQRSFCTH